MEVRIALLSHANCSADLRSTTAVGDRLLKFLHLQNALSLKSPALAPLGERVDRIRRSHQPVRDG